VFVGGGEPAARLIAALRSSPDTHIAVGGIFDDRDDIRSPPLVEGLHKLGNISELVDFVRRARVDLLLVTLPLAAEERLLQILKQIWVLPVDIRLSAYTQKLRYRPRAYSYLGNVPFLDVFDKPLGEWGGIVKTLEDKIIAGLALVLMAPLMLLIAAAVKLESRGPVFFKQKRYGFNNELIEILKFRSMYDDQRDPDAAKLVTKGDPRVTRVGHFIRRASLDELPQLINVLKGDLSLVGPRPHPTRARAGDQLYNDVVDGYFARHKVKPGITGWAQINGWRGETDTAEKLQRRVEHDLYYIENWSLRFDLKILWRTPLALFKGENAY
jgi:Undecaprenyl-phosphate glucose phosphotransferase